MGIYVFIILQSTWGNLENYMMWRDRMYKLESQNDVKNYQVDICRRSFFVWNMWVLFIPKYYVY